MGERVHLTLTMLPIYARVHVKTNPKQYMQITAYDALKDGRSYRWTSLSQAGILVIKTQIGTVFPLSES